MAKTSILTDVIMHGAAEKGLYIIIAEGIFSVTILSLPTSPTVRNDSNKQF